MKDNQIMLVANEARMTQNPIRVLCADSDEAHLATIEHSLSKAGYEVLCATSGWEVLAILKHHPHSVDIILLDRHLQDGDGIEILSKIKDRIILQRMPVIIQTNHACPEEAAKCIESGAYYYISKPYKPHVLNSIVRAAAREHDLNTRLQNRLDKHLAVLSFAQSGTFTIRTLKEARELAAHLAHFSPDPSKAVMALTALMINAIEHGNLKIGHERKNKLLTDMCWQREVDRLLNLPEHADKAVNVSFERQANGGMEVRISDEGGGFNWADYVDFDPTRMTEPGGRGIARAHAMNCGTIRYVAPGNTVIFAITPATVFAEEKVAS